MTPYVPRYVSPKQAAEERARLRRRLFWMASQPSARVRAAGVRLQRSGTGRAAGPDDQPGPRLRIPDAVARHDRPLAGAHPVRGRRGLFQLRACARSGLRARARDGARHAQRSRRRDARHYARVAGARRFPGAAAGRFRRLSPQRRRVLDRVSPSGSSISLSDRDGRHVFNSNVPTGAPLPPRINREAIEHVFRTRQPYYSNLFVGSVSGRRIIAVSIPVLRARASSSTS